VKDVLAIIMAGGKGQRLKPLTRDRSKPAVPFGGVYRLIDITLSNCVNSGIYKIFLLPQYKSQSLVDHLEAGWNIFSYDLGHYLRIISPQMRTGEKWYQGTADSVRQNVYLIERDTTLNHVAILSGDHVYKMDYSLFRDYHQEHQADITISVIEVDRQLARSYGVAEVDPEFNIVAFHEKPQDPAAIPGDPQRSLASMGIYLFKKEVLLRELAQNPGLDFGQDIIPSLLGRYQVKAYPYRRHNRLQDYVYTYDENGRRTRTLVRPTGDSGYWRDVGDLDSFWNANMDLCGVDPYFNLYGHLWPIRTFRRQLPPAKFVFGDERHQPDRVGKALDSLVGAGSIISGAVVRNSVLGCNVIVESWSRVDESVVMDDVVIGRNCLVKKAIIDKGNALPDSTRIGLDPRADAKRFTLTPRGITVVPKAFFAPSP